MENEIIACPSCRGDVEKVKSGYHCPRCDVIFRISREEKKVLKVGALDSLNQRVTDLEKTVGSEPAADPPARDPAPEPDGDPDGDPDEDPDEDDEIFPP